MVVSEDWTLLLETDWAPALQPEFEDDRWRRLQAYLEEERDRTNVLPPRKHIYRALMETRLADTKVVILGQDPYHRAGQADGLCFSVPPGVRQPPSLKNIFKELQADRGVPVPPSGSLVAWAKQGVLLLNAALTVPESEPALHSKWWKPFTDRVIQTAAGKHGVVFLFWGKRAQEKIPLVRPYGRKIIRSSHPSPISVRRCPHPFVGSRPFGRANHALEAAGLGEIDWRLT